MKGEPIIDKTMVSRAVISKIQGDSKPDKILAKHVKEYDTPENLAFKGKKDGYTPDIVAFFKTEANVYEIELEKEVSIEKWRLFDFYAKKYNGRFYIVVPDSLKEAIKKLIKEKEIHAGLIYFKTE